MPRLQVLSCSVVAICGLNGHAYGSWSGLGGPQLNPRKMWLRRFLSEDLPQCRTMIYGYNSKLSSDSVHEIPDFADGFLEKLRKARGSEEVSAYVGAVRKYD